VRRALVTGPSSGIGRALARELAARGFEVALASRNTDALRELSAELASRHPGARFPWRRLDVADAPSVRPALRALASELSGLDLVVANAGVGGSGRIGEGHLDAHAHVVQVNLVGAMATLDAATELFREQGDGHLVAVSSVAAYRGLPGNAAYCASKAALDVYLDALRAELHGTGIRVTNLHPGYIDTPINQDAPARPFVVDATRGARVIADRIERGVGEAAVPRLPWAVVGPLLRFVPTGWLARLARRARDRG
jgi:NAD(P)-dependent dehydrogenase (short-subunit alcohol dehydrogenase family)